MDEMTKDVLGAKAIADLLCIKVNTIHSKRWQKRTRCPFVKRGKKLLCRTEDFWKWFKGDKVEDRSKIS